MRGPGTWIVIALILAVGAFAAGDSLRSALQGEKAPANPTTTRPQPATSLRGALYYTDEECRLRAVRLPELEPEQAPDWSECLFSLSPDELDAAPGVAIWHPGGTVLAGQVGNDIQVFAREGSTTSSYVFRGSGPSFSLQARLTFALGTEIRVMDAGCPLLMSDEQPVPSRAIRRCSTVNVSAEAVERAARRHPDAAETSGVSVRETAWLGSQERPPRLAALLRLRLRSGDEANVIALFERGAVVDVIAAAEPLSGLQPSPGGTYFGVLSQGPSALLVFDRDGGEVAIPEASFVNAFDWSPDEAWMAVSTSTDVLVFVMEGPRRPIRALGLIARDLAWRSS